MGSMVMSTFMMFIPQRVIFVFLAILCVGFFGIYIPYNESKKKGELWGPLRWLNRITERKKKKTVEFDLVSAVGPDKRRQLDQLESLKSAGLVSKQEYQRKRQEVLDEL